MNEKICRSEKSQGHRGHRKVKCEIGQALVMINLYVKFNVHSSYAKQVIVLKVADRLRDGRARLVTTIGIRQNFWLRPDKCLKNHLSPNFNVQTT